MLKTVRALLWCSFCSVLPVNAAPISFVQAWDLLQRDNNSLAAERANVDRYRHLTEATSSLDLPQISIGANYTHLDDDITLSGKQIFSNTKSDISASLAAILAGLNLDVSSLSGFSTTISEQDVITSSVRAIWPIFTGGRITAAQEGALGKEQEATAHFKMEVLARYEDLAKYYFSVVLAKEVVQTRQAVVKGLTTHRDNAVKLEQQGQIAHVERLQADVSLDKAVVDLNKARKNLDIAQNALTKILGQNTLVEPSGTLFINSTLPPMSAFDEQTQQTYPGLAILDAKEQQAKSLAKAEKGKYYPQVYLYGNYKLNEEDTIASQLQPDWMVGIGVSIPLTENTGRGEQLQAASSAMTQVRYLRAQARQDLSVLVQKTYLEAEQALEEVQGLDSSLALAKENLRLRETAFSQGLSTSVDVVDAELYQASIRTQQSVAGFNYLIALTRLLALSSEMNSFEHYHHNAIFLSASSPALTHP